MNTKFVAAFVISPVASFETHCSCVSGVNLSELGHQWESHKQSHYNQPFGPVRGVILSQIRADFCTIFSEKPYVCHDSARKTNRWFLILVSGLLYNVKCYIFIPYTVKTYSYGASMFEAPWLSLKLVVSIGTHAGGTQLRAQLCTGQFGKANEKQFQ